MAGGTVIGRRAQMRAVALSSAGAALAMALGLWSSAPASAGVGQYFLDDLGDFQSPVFAENAPGFPDLLFVVEQGGTVRVLDHGVEQAEPFLDITDLVRFGGEQGLLSIAFHPNYEQNRRFYVFYVNHDGGGRFDDLEVDQFKRREDSAVLADEATRRQVIVVQHNQADNHNGGQLQMDAAGDLYISTGDGGIQNDPENDAQRRKRLLGKILRVSPVPKGGYEVPASNPYVGKPGKDEVYARGLRNPYRFSFDSGSGALTIGDVGGGSREEVDYEPDGGRGANFGWNDFEGFLETSFGSGRNAGNAEDPIFDYPHGGGSTAITGGYVIHDPDLPALAGRYIYADFYDGDLRTLVPAEDGATGDAPLGLNAGLVSSFGEGAGGQIYVVDYGRDVFGLEPNP